MKRSVIKVYPLGRPVKPEVLPRNLWESTYRSWGLSSKSSAAMSEMMDGFNSGWIEFEAPEQSVKSHTSLKTLLAHITR
jgi:hypothetical protein